MPSPTTAVDAAQHPVILVGLSPASVRVLERLDALGIPCVALATAREAEALAPEFRLLDVPLVRGAPPWAIELQTLPLDACGALVIASHDQSVNMDTALAARRLAPELPVLVRLDDAPLRTLLSRSAPGIEPFSAASAAAPRIAALAEAALAARPRRRGRYLAPMTLVRGMLPHPSALFWSIFVGFLAVLLPVSAYFARELRLPLFDAVYFVWVTVFSVGYGDIHLRDASVMAKSVGMAVMLLGAGFTAAMVGLMADWLLTRRLGGLQVRVAVAMRDHAVIIGAGTVGAEVARLLHRRRVPVVVVERDPDAQGVIELRSGGVPVVVGDGASTEIQALASVGEAGIVLALTESDATNIDLALRLEASAGVACMVRVQSEEIARHVAEKCAFTSLSTLTTTADAVTARVVALRAARFPRAPAANACDPAPR